MRAGISLTGWLGLLCALCFPGLFFGNAWAFNSSVGLMLLVPWIAAARSYAAGDGPAEDIGTGIPATIALPSASLFIAVVWKGFIPRFTDPFPFALAIALGLGLFILAGELRFRPSRRQAAALAFFSLLYGYGAAAAINSVGDDSTAAVQEAQVAKRWWSYRLGLDMIELAGEGPYAGLAFPARRPYANAAVGDKVRVDLRKGRLGIYWYSVQGIIEDKQRSRPAPAR